MPDEYERSTDRDHYKNGWIGIAYWIGEGRTPRFGVTSTHEDAMFQRTMRPLIPIGGRWLEARVIVGTAVRTVWSPTRAATIEVIDWLDRKSVLDWCMVAADL